MRPFPSNRLPENLSSYIYGTTRLGDDAVPLETRLEVAARAMNAGIWFHTSEQYGNALSVLRRAFDANRARVPQLIVKLGNESVDEIRATIARHAEALAVTKIDVGQLCLGGQLAEDFARGGRCYEDLKALRVDGLVDHFVLEVFPWTSHVALQALRSGDADDLIDGCILYFNPLQRFASNELWDLLVARHVPVIAMRTVAGGDVLRLRDVPGAAWKPYLQARATEVAPLFENSEVATWSEFCVRFAHSSPLVRATVGATSDTSRLEQFLRAAKGPAPLEASTIEKLDLLQRRWADHTDANAQPWTM